jgi:spore maturation protein CgeB
VKIAFYGSGLLGSGDANGAAYFRGMIKALCRRGYDLTLYHPGQNSSQPAPEGARLVHYDAAAAAVRESAAKAAAADVVIHAGGQGNAPLGDVFTAAQPGALKIWWDADWIATTTELKADPDHPLRRHLREANCVLTRDGGAAAIDTYLSLGARDCVTAHGAVDPDICHPVPAELPFAAGLAFLGDRTDERPERVAHYFLEPAAALADFRFLLGGAGWDGEDRPANVTYVGELSERECNAFRASPKSVLHVAGAATPPVGVAPPARVLEAAAAGACVVSEPWLGVESFLTPGEEILIARDGKDVADLVRSTELAKARDIGKRALKRIRREHTFDRRAEALDRLFRALREGKRSRAAA